MKRWTLILGVAAICVAATSQAQASFTVIRWKSGFCQVWDNSFKNKPWTKDYKAVSKPQKTFVGAMAIRTKLAGKKKCW